MYSQAYDISALLLCRNLTWSYCGHLPGERGLAGYHLGFLHLFQKRIFEDKWHVFCGQYAFLLPSKECQSTEWSSKYWPQPGNVASWPCPFLIRYRTPEEGPVLPLQPAVQWQHPSPEVTVYNWGVESVTFWRCFCVDLIFCELYISLYSQIHDLITNN